MCLTLMEIEFRYRAGDNLVTDSFERMDFVGFRIIHGYRQHLLAIMIHLLLIYLLSAPPMAMDMGHAWQRPALSQVRN
jgi:hypothetical protein